MPEPMTPREATLRTAGITGLCGLAVVQLLALPYALVQGPQIAAVSAVTIVVALRRAAALATADAPRGRAAWRAVAALGGAVTAAWVVTRAVAVPGVAEDAGRWTSGSGLASAAFAAGVAALAVARGGVPRGWRGLRAAAPAAGVALALVPAAALALIALGPPPAHHHGLSPASIGPHAFHATASSAPGAAARFRPGFGGHAGHYIYANATTPHLPRWILALALGA